MTEVCYIWASSSTTVVVCGIFFIVWRCFIFIRKRGSPIHSSSQQVCKTCQIDKHDFGEFQLSYRRQNTNVGYDLHGTRSDVNAVIQGQSVLRPSPVPVEVLPVEGNRVSRSSESIRTHSSTHSAGNSSHIATSPVSSSCSAGKETSPKPYSYCRDIYSISERSTMKTVGGKLVVSVAHNVTSRGDCLMLDDMGISLWIPPNAVPIGEEKLICLVLNWDLGDNPPMTVTDSLVSPVVFVGPHGLKLNKPCELHYRHCAYDPRQIVVMRSETELHGDKHWTEMCGHENQNGVCRLSSDECILQIDTFTLYTCIQRPLRNLKMAKWLQIAAFSNPLEKRIDHHEVRVYFLNKTPCALQWAIQNEAQFQHVLICPEKAFLFHGQVDDILDIRVTLKYLSSDWESVDNDVYERVPYLHIWHGQCPHIVMCFKKKPKHSVRELNFHLNIYQDTLENEGEKIVVHATEDPRCVYDNSCIINIHTSESQGKKTLPNVEVKKTEDNVNVSINQSHCPSAVLLEEMRTESTQYIPYDIRKHLKVKLDPPNPLGNDWRRLAEVLDLSQFIEYLKSLHSSPTEALLSVIEHRNISLEELATMLNEIQRYDAENIVSNYLRQQQTSSPVCIGGGLQHDERPFANMNATNNLGNVEPGNVSQEEDRAQYMPLGNSGHDNNAYM